MMSDPRTRRAFALPDLAALLVCIGLLAAVLTIMGDRSRRAARLGEDIANLRQIGTWTRSYSADFADQIWGFSWKVGNYTTTWPDLVGASTDRDAAAAQAIAILRDRTGRTDLPPTTSWLANFLYSHLPLADYLDAELPARWAISAGDRHRLAWAADPACFDQGCFLPHQPSTLPSNRRWVYSASFQLPPALWDAGLPGRRISPALSHSTYSTPFNHSFGGLRIDQILYPTGKVFVHAGWGRHFGKREPYLIMPEARVTVLLSDGSAGVRHSAEANEGCNPNLPTSSVPLTITYSPRDWEPRPVSSPSTDYGPGRYLWTRMGIAGRDFGGPEVFP